MRLWVNREFLWLGLVTVLLAKGFGTNSTWLSSYSQDFSDSIQFLQTYTSPFFYFCFISLTCESSSLSVSHQILSNLCTYLSNPFTPPHLYYATTLVQTIISHLKLHGNLLTHLFHSYPLQSVLHTIATGTFPKILSLTMLLFFLV